jgi:hypothetical protein
MCRNSLARWATEPCLWCWRSNQPAEGCARVSRQAQIDFLRRTVLS